jgi:hypothetical protein
MRFREIGVFLLLALAGCNLPTAAGTDPNSAKSAAPSNYALPSSGTLGLIDLANFAKQKRDFVKPDDFSKGFDDRPLNGRSFVLNFSLPSYAGSALEPGSWTYDANNEELTLNATTGDLDPAIILQYTSEDGSKKTMSNAFGAQVEVTPTETWIVALGRNDDKPLGVFPKSKEDYSINPFEPLSYTMKLKPDQAKALVADLQIRLEGVVEKDDQGETVYCADNHTTATIDLPTEREEHKCTVSVHLSRVAFLRKDGRVLKEWLDKPRSANVS